MPSEPTVEEVRELLRRYSGEPPEPPPCSVCAKPMFVSEVSSEGFEFGCRCGHEVRSSEPYLFDKQVSALCRAYLAAHDPLAKPQMTAGEFAELVAQKVKDRASDWRSSMARIPSLAESFQLNALECDNVFGLIHRVAAEHNIEIVEPKE